MSLLTTVQGLQISYQKKGHGQPIFFLHGLGGSSADWKSVIPYLSNNGFQCFSLDFPGYGHSEKPMQEYSISYYAAFLVDFIQKMKLKEAPVLVGNSMGGHIAAYFAAKYKSRLKALVLVDSSGLNEMSSLEEFMLNVAFDKNHVGMIFKYMVDILAVNLFHDSRCENARIFIQEQEELSLRSDYPGYCHALEQCTKAMMKMPLKDYISEITVPTGIFWGANDRLIPQFYGERFHKNIEGAQFVSLPRCGHMPQLEKPGEFIRELCYFLDESGIKSSMKKKKWFSWLRGE